MDKSKRRGEEGDLGREREREDKGGGVRDETSRERNLEKEEESKGRERIGALHPLISVI